MNCRQELRAAPASVWCAAPPAHDYDDDEEEEEEEMEEEDHGGQVPPILYIKTPDRPPQRLLLVLILILIYIALSIPKKGPLLCPGMKLLYTMRQFATSPRRWHSIAAAPLHRCRDVAPLATLALGVDTLPVS